MQNNSHIRPVFIFDHIYNKEIVVARKLYSLRRAIIITFYLFHTGTESILPPAHQQAPPTLEQDWRRGLVPGSGSGVICHFETGVRVWGQELWAPQLSGGKVGAT